MNGQLTSRNRNRGLFSLLFLFFMGSTILTPAQLFGQGQPVRFSKRISFGDSTSSFGYSVLEENDGGYSIFASRLRPPFPYTSRSLLLLRTDEQGNISYEKSYQEDSVGYVAHSLEQDHGKVGGPLFQHWKDGYVVAPTSDKGLNGSRNGHFMRLDANFDTLWTRRFGSDSSEMSLKFYHMLYLPRDTAFLLSGRKNLDPGQGGTKAKGWLVKMDTSGQVLWERAYGDNSSSTWYGHTISNIAKTPDGGFIAVGFQQTTRGGWAFKVDSMGNKEWEKFYGQDPPYMWYNVIPTQDSNYVLAGEYQTDSTPNNRTGMMQKIDGQGNELWRKYYFLPASSDTGSRINGAIETADGRIFMFGTKRNTCIGPCNYDKNGFLQSTLPGGEREWHRTPAEAGAEDGDGTGPDNILLDVRPTSDGGFIGVGYIDPPLSSPDTVLPDIWLLKLDSLGCDTPGCAVPTLSWPEAPAKSFELFPNPNDGQFTVRSAGEKGRFEATLSVRDMQGRTVLRKELHGRYPHEEELHLPRTASGVHFVEWKEGTESYVEKMVVE